MDSWKWHQGDVSWPNGQREEMCSQFLEEYMRDFWHIRAFFTNIWPRSVRLRTNCTANEEVFCQPKDIALKFRGCFQAVCESPGVPIGGGWLVRRVVWCMADRAWSSLNLPIELRSDPLPPLSLSLSLALSSSLSSLRPSKSTDLFLPHSPHHSRTLTSLPSFYPLPTLRLLCAQATKRTVTSRCPFDRFIETATHSASHLHELFFIALDNSPSRVDKRTNRDQHLTFCQVNDYSCAKRLVRE